MKKLLYILFISCSFALFQSCDDSLNIKPQGIVMFEDMYNTPAQINLALNGMYNMLASGGMYGSNLFLYTEIGNDEAYCTSSTAGYYPYTHNEISADGSVTSLWNSCYTGVDRANSIIEAMATSPADSLVKVSAVAQAKFVRGLIYSVLADRFGGVPIRLKPVNSYIDVRIARNALPEVYAQIIKDLTEAEADLPTMDKLGTTGSGKPSKSAAQALLAKVNLKMAGYPINDATKFVDAKNWAYKVMSSNLHILNPDYKQMFINLAQDKYDPKESIFEIEFKINPTGATAANFGALGYRMGINCSNVDTGYCANIVAGTKKLWNTYNDPNDKRRDWNFATYTFKTVTTTTGTTTTSTTSRSNFTSTSFVWGERNPGKYRREYEPVSPKIKFQTGINFPLIRYADVLLMFAEAENEINGPTTDAFNAVNLVRARSGASVFTLSTTPDKAAFRSMIMDERLRELCFEGVRTHDLIRWGIFVSSVKAFKTDLTAPTPPAVVTNLSDNISDKNVLLPIPLSEMTNNTLMLQNVGY